MRRNNVPSVGDLGLLIVDGLKNASHRPTVSGYVPHLKQLAFHSATQRGRLYIGGNRAGKTVAGIVEDINYARGIHPYRKVPSAPTRGRIVSVSLEEGVKKIIIPELKRWVIPSDLINGSWEDSYSASSRTLTFNNGSFIELMSYDQDVDKFSGVSRHWTHFDEEPPKPIFTECKMRLLDTAGSYWITMTPVDGMTWIYDDIFLLSLEPSAKIAVIIVDTAENPHVSAEEIEDVISGLDENERAARKEGRFVNIGRPVFSQFDFDRHVIPELNVDQLKSILNWSQYNSMDYGLRNPTVWLWHAVGSDGTIISFDEISASGLFVNDFALMINEKNNKLNRRVPDIYVGDPSIAQRNGIQGDTIKTAYSNFGIDILLGNNNQHIGVEKMNRYLKGNKWFITNNCPQLISSLQRTRWKIYDQAKRRADSAPREEIHRKHADPTDSARYFFSILPDLYIPQYSPDNIKGKINNVINGILTPSIPTLGPYYYDTNLRTDNSSSTEWTVIDEHMGGIY